MTTTPPFHWHRSGRNRASALVILGIWLSVGAAYLLLEASIWIVIVLLLFTLPALYDFVTDRRSAMHVTKDGLAWHSGPRQDRLSWAEVEYVRLDTRLDLSVRTSVILPSGRRLRLPIDVTPPVDLFEAALKAHGVRVERHHFSLLG